MRKLLLPLLLLAMTLAAQGYYMIVHNPNSQDLRNFQVRVKLPAELVGKPISMTDQLGNPVPFCYETGVGECTTDPTQGDGYIWVKVPNIPANGDTKLIVQVGTNGAVKGDQVFDFYDDFNEGSLDTNKWITAKQDGYDEPEPKVENGILKLVPDGDHPWNKVRTKETMDLINKIVETRKLIHDPGNTYWWNYYSTSVQYDNGDGTLCDAGVCAGDNVGWGTGCDWGAFQTFVGEGEYTCLYNTKRTLSDGGTHCCDGEPVEGEVWYIQRDFILDNNTLVSVIKTENGKVSASGVEYSVSNGYIILLCEYNGECWLDWIRVRKYAPQEPTVTFEVYKEVPQQVALIQPAQPSVFKAYQELVTIYNEVSKSSGYKATLLKGPFQSNIIYLATLAQLNDVYNRFNMFKQELIQSITELKELMKKEPTFDNVYKMMNLVQRCKVDLAMMRSTLQQMKQIVEEMKTSIPAVTCDYKKAKEIILGILNAKTIEEIVKYRLEASKMGGLDKVVKCLFKYTMEKTIKDFTEFEEKAKKELNEYSSKLKEYEMIVKLLSVR